MRAGPGGAGWNACMTPRLLAAWLALAPATFTLSAAGPDLSKVDLSKLPPAAKKSGLTYEKDIRPILEASCFRCHGADRQRGELRLDSLGALLKGGENGKVVEPGRSTKSLLVIAAAQIDDETAMPPKRRPGGGPGGPGRPGGAGPGGPGGGPGGPPAQPLTAEQVGLLRAWVDQGAK